MVDNPMHRFDNIRIFGFVLCVLIFAGCESGKTNRENMILGHWTAMWETTMEDLENIDRDNLKMHGNILFRDDGQVVIEAYGHDGCVFSSDTLKNQLQWKLDGETLRFIDKGDDMGLPYQIKNFHADQVELVLMNDIFLTLKR